MSGVLGEVAARFGFIAEYLTTDTTQPLFERFVRSLFAPLREDLGLQAKSTDSEARRALRAVMVRVLGGPGGDPAIGQWALDRLNRTLAGGEALDPTLAPAVVSIAAAHGDAALFDRLADAAEEATDPEVHYRYLYALTQFSDPVLIDRALEKLLTTEIRVQDARLFLSRFFDNPAARDRAWAFVKAHWTALEPKIGVFLGASGLVGALDAFCDQGARDDIANFFAAHPQPAAARTLRQTLETIDRCLAIKARETGKVGEWLRNQ
jgi:aminopeptidase N/puromycin-sensitive aminopeptidase